MSGGSKISPWLANLAQQAFLPQAGRQAGNAEGYVVPNNAEKFVPNRRVAGKQILKRKLRKLVGPTSKMPDDHMKSNKPWELAMEGGDEREGQHWWPQKTVTLGEAALQCSGTGWHSLTQGTLWSAQGAEEPDKQWTRNINGILAFLSSTVEVRIICTIWYSILYFWKLKLTGIFMKSVFSESMYQLPQLYIVSTLYKHGGLIKIQPTSSSSVWDFSKGWSSTTLQLEIRQGKSN